MGLVICPNLHRNSESGVGEKLNCFGDLTVQQVSDSSQWRQRKIASPPIQNSFFRIRRSWKASGPVFRVNPPPPTFKHLASSLQTDAHNWHSIGFITDQSCSNTDTIRQLSAALSCGLILLCEWVHSFTAQLTTAEQSLCCLSAQFDELPITQPRALARPERPKLWLKISKSGCTWARRKLTGKRLTHSVDPPTPYLLRWQSVAHVIFGI